MPWRRKVDDRAAEAGDECGRAAGAEPVGIETGGFDQGKGLLELRELGLGDEAVGFVRGEQMGGDAFKPERRLDGEAGEKRGQAGKAGALAAHAGVDFKLDGERADTEVGGTRGGLEHVEMAGSQTTGVRRCSTMA